MPWCGGGVKDMYRRFQKQACTLEDGRFDRKQFSRLHPSGLLRPSAERNPLIAKSAMNGAPDIRCWNSAWIQRRSGIARPSCRSFVLLGEMWGGSGFSAWLTQPTRENLRERATDRGIVRHVPVQWIRERKR